MRLTTILTALAVIGLGYWAYHQTIQTQLTAREVVRLERAIAAEHERLSVLRAEWAYLNRPDRLRELANFNFERLGLLPLAPEQFADVALLPFPAPVAQVQELLLENASGGEASQ